MKTNESNELDEMYSQAMEALKLHHFDNAITLLDKAANMGSIAAILRIAGIHYFGIGIEPDTDKAIEYLLLAGNNALALGNLGHIYYLGMEATEENVRKAWEYYDRAEKLDSRYIFYMARMCFDKRVEEVEDYPILEEAETYFSVAFDEGEPISGLYLWKINQMMGKPNKGKEYLAEAGRRLMMVLNSPRDYNNAAAALCSFGEYDMALPYIETCLSMVDDKDEHPAYFDTQEKILQGLGINK